jgi:hypothetical protein
MKMVSVLCVSVSLWCALGSGCGGSAATRSVAHRVEPELVAVFPEEGRRWTYEAENEVIIALDRLDAARDRVEKASAEIDAAERAIEAATERGGQGREVSEARRQLAFASRDQAEAEVRAAEIGVYCARGSLELTKARLAIRFDLPVEEEFVKKYEEQYQACAANLDEAKDEAEKKAGAAQAAREKWREVRSEFVKRTGDHNHGLWID